MRKLIFILIALVSFSQAQTIQYIGAPTTTVISRGNFRTDSIFYLPKRTKTPTDTAAFRYQISDSSLYYWTGYQWMKVGNNQDTASMLSNYVRGSGTTNYFPKFNSTRSIVDSKLYESNLNLLFNTTTPYVTTSGISTIENNGTSAALYVLKTLDTARAYISFGGANTMDINNLRAGDIRFYTNAMLRGRFQTDGTFRLNSLTGTGSRIVVADDNGVLSATSSATGLVDTTVLSTRAYRQKGDDSLGAIIATKGSGTVTSVATGYGLSGGTITTTGTLIADTALIASRLRLGKVADSLSLVKQNVLTNPVTGTGTTNYVPKFTNTRELGNSQIFDNGTNVGINQTSPTYKFQVDISDATVYSSSNTLTAPPVAWFYNNNSSNLGIASTIRLDAGNFTGNNAVSISAVRTGNADAALTFGTRSAGGNVTERARFNSSGELLINTTTDAGAYTLQNNGALYNTGSAILAATSGNVGIGTTSPSLKLQVSGDIGTTTRIATDLINGWTGGGTPLTIQTGGAQSVIIGTNATERIRVTSTGNVGIDNNSPNAKLDVNGSAIFRNLTYIGDDNAANDANKLLLRLNAGSDATLGTLYLNTELRPSATGSNRRVDIYSGDNASYRNINFPFANIGIGTTSPTQKLEVNGNILANNGVFYSTTTLYPQIILTETTGSTNSVMFYDGGAATKALRFRVNSATDFLSITTAGESLFGTTTDAGNYRVQVSGNAYVTGDAILAVGASSNNVRIGSANASSAKLFVSKSGLNTIFDSGAGTDARLEFHYNGNRNSLLNFDSGITGFQQESGITFYFSGGNGVSVGSSSINSTAILDVQSTTKGFLPPRMTSTQRDAISSPAAGLVIYNTTTSKLQVYTTSWTDLH